VTDDAAALQRAIAAAIAEQRTLLVPAGQYAVSVTLVILHTPTERQWHRTALDPNDG
jgi:hypothetical protein